MSESQDHFEAACTWLSSSTAAGRLPNDTKLELYGLFKFINSSSGPTGARPGIFSFEGRAKYDSWARIAGEYADRGDDARARYVEIARSVGWKEGEEVGEEGEGEGVKKRGGGGGGFGPSVSMLVAEDDEGGEASPVHDAAAAGDMGALRALLDGKRGMVDGKDEFGFTPLHLAADRGHADAVSYLLSIGADKSILDPDDQTALDIATVSARDDIVTLLA